MFLQLFKLSLNNLSRARGRLAITASGVLIGTTAVVLLIGMTLGLQESAEAGIGDDASLTKIQVRPNFQTLSPDDDAKLLTLDAINEIETLPGVAAAIPLLPLDRNPTLLTGRLENNVQVRGVRPDDLPYLNLTIEEGALDGFEEGAVIIGTQVLSRFVNPSAESWIPETLTIGDIDRLRLRVDNLEQTSTERRTITPIASVNDSNGDFSGLVLMRLDEVRELNEWISGEERAADDIAFDEILVRSTGREQTNIVAQQINEMGFATESLGNFLSELNNFFGIMRLILGGVGGVALLIAAFGVANTMMMAALERTSEIGLMKAIGARDRDVLLIFLLEAGLVGFAGGIVGAGLALLTRNQINEWVATAPATGNQLNLPFDPTRVQGELIIIPVELMLFAVALATVVGVLAGVFPALRAARMSPVDALKSE